MVVAQLGARRRYAVPRILQEAGMLERLFTDSYAGNKPWLESGLRRVPRRLRHRALEQWLGRKDSAIPPAKVKSFDLLGIEYWHRLRRAHDSATVSEAYVWGAREFGSRVVRIGFGNADTVWGFDGASLEIFQAARAKGLRCIIEQTIAPPSVTNRLLRAELERWPGWQPDLQIAVEVTENERRQAAEWELADVIVCGSKFVVDGIAECGGPVEKCRVVPYGYDGPLSAGARSPKAAPIGRPLHLLFVGSVSLRKGAPYLLEALRRVPKGKVKARFLGQVHLNWEKLHPFRELVQFFDLVPHSQIAEMYDWADALVLPSVSEGSAMVTHEAQQFGLPVICTRNAGADIIEGVTGITVPCRDAAAIAEAIGNLSHLLADPRRSGDSVMLQGSFALYRQRLETRVVRADH